MQDPRDPTTFMPGYINSKNRKYMNIGYVSSPFPGKTGEGDYGPLQGGGIYYRPNNPTYYTPMDNSIVRDTIPHNHIVKREQRMVDQGFYV